MTCIPRAFCFYWFIFIKNAQNQKSRTPPTLKKILEMKLKTNSQITLYVCSVELSDLLKVRAVGPNYIILFPQLQKDICLHWSLIICFCHSSVVVYSPNSNFQFLSVFLIFMSKSNSQSPFIIHRSSRRNSFR